jgi:polar amino acid transport system substrate-binding protein
VRWTENRNLQAFLALAASGAIDPGRLDAQTVDFADAEKTYEELAGGARRGLAVVFRYDTNSTGARSVSLAPRARAARDGVGVAFLGAGNYAKAILLPALDACSDVRKLHVATATGASARHTAERFGFASCGTDAEAVLTDPAVDLVFVATQHDTHAPLAEAALRAGKAVWLEKPAALDEAQLETLLAAARETGGFLSVGYNRRFSPHTSAIREAFAGRQSALSIHYAVAPGPPPAGTWHTDPAVGGGRVIGEVCHFVDLCVHLVGAVPHSVAALAPGRDPERDDSVVALLGFPDGSSATIEYLASASPELPKERIEVSCGGRTLRCDNFRTTTSHGGGPRVRTLNQDKGQRAGVALVVAAVRGGSPAPIPLDEIAGVSRATFAILAALRSGETETLDAD